MITRVLQSDRVIRVPGFSCSDQSHRLHAPLALLYRKDVVGETDIFECLIIASPLPANQLTRHPAIEWFVFVCVSQIYGHATPLYTFSMAQSVFSFRFMVRIHTNARAHDIGEATNEYPPYLIKDDSE